VPEALRRLREAGRVAAAVRRAGAARIVPGASLLEVCAFVEDEIRRSGAGPAFPVQSSRNELAAHYCASPEDETLYADGDLAKLDIGVHVDGYVVDTAVTVNVGDRPDNRPLIDAAQHALEAAIAAAGPGVEVRRVSQAIEAAIEARGLRPMRNLCGHGVGRWLVHCPPAIPNVAALADGARLRPGQAVAIEPFATDGLGLVAERGSAEVFRADPAGLVTSGLGAGILHALRELRGLPFSRRDLARFPRGEVDGALEELRRAGALTDYAPLAEAGGRRVAQAEHTLWIGEDGVEVLTS
jgi:methionyl aminopeptidase